MSTAFESSAVETDEGRRARVPQSLSNQMALFAVKSHFDEDIEDFRMWTSTGEEEGDRELKEVILAYKKRASIRNNGGWIYLIVPPNMEEESLGDVANTRGTSLDIYDVFRSFEIYSEVKGDEEANGKFEDPEKIIVYLYNQESLVFNGDMVEESQEKDFIFSEGVWKLKEDLEIKKELIERFLNESSQAVGDSARGDTPTGFCRDRLLSDAEEFTRKLAFVLNRSGWEEMERSARKEMMKRITASECDSVRNRLMGKMREKAEIGSKNYNVVFGSDLAVILEEVSEMGFKEMPKIRFNLSDPVPDFVGRERVLGEALYFLGGTCKRREVGPPKTLVLSGLGGVGKSELAREYCRRHFASLYDAIAWIDAERIGPSIRALAREKLGLCGKGNNGGEEAVSVAKEVFDRLKSRRTLLIYDNVKSLHGIIKYLPDESLEGRMHVVLTTRSQVCGGLPMILLGNFQQEEALDLKDRCFLKLPRWSKEEWLNLCRTLKCVPLVLKLALSYIREQEVMSTKHGRTYSFLEYNNLLESTPNLILGPPLSWDVEGDYLEITCRVMLGSLKYLLKSPEGYMAIKLLNVLSYLSPEDIDVDAMLVANPNLNGSLVLESFTVLSKLSLVSLHRNKARIHRSVQTVNRVRCRILGEEVGALRDAMNYVLRMDGTNMLSVWEHARRHESLIKESPHFPNATSERLLAEEAFDVALSFSTGALESMRKYLGPRHSAVVNMACYAAIAHQHCGETEEGLGLMKECLDAWNYDNALKTPHYFHALLFYGTALMMLRRFDGANVAFNDILSHGTSLLGAESDLIQMAKCQLLRMGRILNPGLDLEDDFKMIEVWIRGNIVSGISGTMIGTTAGAARKGGNAENRKFKFCKVDDAGGGNIVGMHLVWMSYVMALYENGKLKRAYEESRKVAKLFMDDGNVNLTLRLKSMFFFPFLYPQLALLQK